MTLPTAEELEGTGLTPEDYEADDAEVWPENWPAWCLFDDMRTQWRTRGMDGRPYGLDYAVLFRLMDEDGLKGREWRETLDSIRVLEGAALEEMRKQHTK
jgi:hypothetical protein